MVPNLVTYIPAHKPYRAVNTDIVMKLVHRIEKMIKAPAMAQVMPYKRIRLLEKILVFPIHPMIGLVGPPIMPIKETRKAPCDVDIPKRSALIGIYACTYICPIPNKINPNRN